LRAVGAIKDPAVREHAREMLNRIFMVNFKMMVLKSPLLILLLGFAYVAWKFLKFCGWSRDRFWALFDKAGDAIQIEAETACA
jgi:hypothetical protein